VTAPRHTLDGVVGQALRRLQDTVRDTARAVVTLAARVTTLEVDLPVVLALLEGGLALTTELAPGSETVTGYTWDGKVVYLQRFTGASLANDTALIGSGIESCLHMKGWNSLAAGSRWPVLYTNAPTGAYGIAIVTGGALRSRAAGTFLSQPYDWSVWYTKV
jgi:hypothetical protein